MPRQHCSHPEARALTGKRGAKAPRLRASSSFGIGSSRIPEGLAWVASSAPLR